MSATDPAANQPAGRTAAVVAVAALSLILLAAGAAGAYLLAQSWRTASEQESGYAWSAAKRAAEKHVEQGEFALALEAIDSFRARTASSGLAEEAAAMHSEIAAAKKDAETRLLAGQQKRTAYGEKLDRARQLMQEGTYDEAIAVLERAAAILPEDPGAARMIEEAKRARGAATE